MEFHLGRTTKEVINTCDAVWSEPKDMQRIADCLRKLAEYAEMRGRALKFGISEEMALCNKHRIQAEKTLEELRAL
jgi:hypothetical protein